MIPRPFLSLLVSSGLAGLSSPAFASTVAGVPTSVKVNNSVASGTACEIVLAGNLYKVDDVQGEFGATCLGALVARSESRSITISYSIVGADRMVQGIYSSNTASTVDYIYTNNYTGTGLADRCKAYVNSLAGNLWMYVDDGGPEEDITCAEFFLLQTSGRGWSLTYTGSEVTSLTMQ